MNAIKKTYDDIPETITVPEEFIHKKGEVIFIIDEQDQQIDKRKIEDFYGVLPDFPERSAQGDYEKREDL